MHVDGSTGLQSSVRIVENRSETDLPSDGIDSIVTNGKPDNGQVCSASALVR
jgi:hypothetical protein